jgi:hypothetical protein
MAHKAFAWPVMALAIVMPALIIAVVLLRKNLLHDDGSMPSSATAQSETRSMGNGRTARIDVAAQSAGRPSEVPKHDARSISPSETSLPLGPRVADKPFQSQMMRSHHGEEVSKSVGVPFPVSSAVQKTCGEFSSSETDCHELYKARADMAQEPRDPDWAETMEAALRDVVSRESGEYVIRTIECRTSLCGVEVASNYGQFPNKDIEPAPMSLVDKMTGYEYDAAGERVTVTFWMLRKR